MTWSARRIRAMVALCLLLTASLAAAWGRKPPKEEVVRVTERPLPTSEVMGILHRFPEMVPSDMASNANDTSFLVSTFGFSEISAVPLEHAFGQTRFYKCLNSEQKPPRYPYLIAVVEGRRIALPDGFNQLLANSGHVVTPKTMIELSRAFVLLAAGFTTMYLDDERGVERSGVTVLPEVTFLDADRTTKPVDGVSYDVELKVKVNTRPERWYFGRAHGQFRVVLRKAGVWLVDRQYDLPDAKPALRR